MVDSIQSLTETRTPTLIHGVPTMDMRGIALVFTDPETGEHKSSFVFDVSGSLVWCDPTKGNKDSLIPYAWSRLGSREDGLPQYSVPRSVKIHSTGSFCSV